jgi:hypothetical protein
VTCLAAEHLARPGLASFLQRSGRYVEYHLVGTAAAGALPEAEVLGQHYAGCVRGGAKLSTGSSSRSSTPRSAT